MPTGHSRYGAFDESVFKTVEINSRKELEDIAKEEKLDINFNKWWKLWDELVEKTKQDIKEELQDYHYQQEQQKHKNNKPFVTVYVYNLDGQFINQFQTPQEAAKHYGINAITINQCIRNKIPYFKQRLYFSKTPLNNG